MARVTTALNVKGVENEHYREVTLYEKTLGQKGKVPKHKWDSPLGSNGSGSALDMATMMSNRSARIILEIVL